MTGVADTSLPTSWLWVQASHVADVVTGNTPPTSDASNYGGEIPFIKPPQLVNTSISTAPETISSRGAAFARVLPAGAVLVSCIGNLGKTAILKVRSATNQQINALVFDSGVMPEFGFYYAQTMEPWLVAASSATTVAIVNKGKFENAPFPLAPAAEQTRIVEKLEELFSDLDAGVAELKAAQKKLTQYRQSLLKAAVEGALTAEWREHNQPVESGAQLLERILKERRARWQAKQLAKFKEQGKAPPKDWQDKYPEPVKPDTSDLPALPEGWVWASIDQMAHVGTGVTPLRSKPAYFENGSIAWVTSGALNAETVTTATEYVSELALKECRLELYPVGALLVAMYGEGKTRGKCSELLIPATINQAIAALVLEPQAMACKAYLKTFLLHSYEAMRGQASGGVQPNLNLQIIKTIALPLPPVVEQQEIASQIEQQFEQLERQKEAAKHALKQSTAQRKNILKAAFSGQLVPQDPNDEPASVLLARIRAERAGSASKPRAGRRKVALADQI